MNSLVCYWFRKGQTRLSLRYGQMNSCVGVSSGSYCDFLLMMYVFNAGMSKYVVPNFNSYSCCYKNMLPFVILIEEFFMQRKLVTSSTLDLEIVILLYVLPSSDRPTS